MNTKQLHNFLRKIQEHPNGCWLWQGSKNPDGYGRFNLNGHTLMAHKILYELIIGPIPAGLYLLHKCDTPNCVHPLHTFPGTQKVNMQDAVQKRRIAFGERVGCAKLSDREGREVRDLAKCGLFMQKDIAEWYTIHPSTVANIKRGYRRSMT